MGSLKELMVCLSLIFLESVIRLGYESKIKTVFRCPVIGGKKVASAFNVIT